MDGRDDKERQLASEFQTRLEPLPPPSTTTVYTPPFPFFKLAAVSKPSNTILPSGETTDPLILTILEVYNELEDLMRRLELTMTSELDKTLELAEKVIAQCKDSRQRESFLLELAAEIVETKVEVRRAFGEDSPAYRILVLHERRINYRLKTARIVRLLLSKYLWLVVLSLFLLWFLFRVKGLA
ncbi:uncharacterized protein BT62DRAFT_1081790 [Guyanagaster necrorhizus]|uniref:Uncharacterized protein n=1 Tax=Guyanagaster necrorhizus TaxID=856835 RepID=A0A9P7VFM2_9AGAR|nr:uncharacterized protein BT62DRAFT_1081790 [Guyanagaster necrorhizus MCA 3950]KAG7439109.1 hypothetical protein BT62DRAFT_1081790 [Guyanagaster necrorhizus MCA 3950]